MAGRVWSALICERFLSQRVGCAWKRVRNTDVDLLRFLKCCRFNWVWESLNREHCLGRIHNTAKCGFVLCCNLLQVCKCLAGSFGVPPGLKTLSEGVRERTCAAAGARAALAPGGSTAARGGQRHLGRLPLLSVRRSGGWAAPSPWESSRVSEHKPPQALTGPAR